VRNLGKLEVGERGRVDRRGVRSAPFIGWKRPAAKAVLWRHRWRVTSSCGDPAHEVRNLRP
jgi:hypothetical protein